MPQQMERGVELVQTALAKITDFLVNYSFQVLGAIVVLVLGAIAARWVGQRLLRLLQRRKFDPTLSKFAVAIARAAVMGFAVIVALGKFGITITPLIAGLSALIFGGTFALQGPLSNFAAGLTLLISRPFVIGNTITVAGVSGVVQDLQLGATVLLNQDGERITIPNKHIVGEVVKNSYEFHVVEGEIGISYADDPARAIAIIEGLCRQMPEVAKNPAPAIGITTFGESSINLAFRYWVPTAQFYRASFAMNLAIWNALKAAGITIPFPQREVRLLAERS